MSKIGESHNLSDVRNLSLLRKSAADTANKTVTDNNVSSQFKADSVTLSPEATKALNENKSEHSNKGHGHGHGKTDYSPYKNHGDYISHAAKAGIHGKELAELAKGEYNKEHIFTPEELKKVGNGEMTFDDLLKNLKAKAEEAKKDEETKKAEEAKKDEIKKDEETKKDAASNTNQITQPAPTTA